MAHSMCVIVVNSASDPKRPVAIGGRAGRFGEAASFIGLTAVESKMSPAIFTDGSRRSHSGGATEISCNVGYCAGNLKMVIITNQRSENYRIIRHKT